MITLYNIHSIVDNINIFVLCLGFVWRLSTIGRGIWKSSAQHPLQPSTGSKPLCHYSEHRLTTADFLKNVPPVYTHSMTTIYLSVSAQVGKGTILRKSPVAYMYIDRQPIREDTHKEKLVVGQLSSPFSGSYLLFIPFCLLASGGLPPPLLVVRPLQKILIFFYVSSLRWRKSFKLNTVL